MNLSFFSGTNQLSRLTGSVLIITGTGRSGKTTVGNLLGSCEDVEHIDEPWLPMMLPILASNGMLAEDLAIDLFVTCTVELLYDRYLMRNANFRPQDLSSVWRQKTPKEIFSKLIGFVSRDDVRQYAREKRPTLVLTLTNTVPYYDFFQKALPGCQIIHVAREGLDVAIEFAQKRWLSDQEHLNPVEAVPRREYTRESDGSTYHLPHWLEAGWEEQYLSSSEFARGLHYWRRLMQMAGVGSNNGLAEATRLVKLEDVLHRPRETIDALTESLCLTKTELTETLLSRISPQGPKETPTTQPNELERQELAAVKEIYRHLGMPTHKIDELLCTARN